LDQKVFQTFDCFGNGLELEFTFKEEGKPHKKDLEEKQYRVAMPTCPTDRKQKQLTTEEANQTKLVTKVRYKVEVVNGILKQNRLLDRVRPNIQAHVIMADWKIAGALYNLYFKPIESDKDDHSFIATRMKARLEIKNTLIEEADRMDRKRLCWSPMNDKTIVDFPKMDLMDMRCLTLGSYQIKQSLQYTKEHMSKTGDYDIQICNDPDKPCLIRAKIQSRHLNQKQYNVYVDYEPYTEGYEAIKRYYCRCGSGSRTVGMCSHTTSVVMYLGYSRHTEPKRKTFEELGNIFNTEDIDESDDE
jgi:hypothetical protein